MKLLNYLNMPLLTKELIEQANRKRTYVIRALCAIAMTLISVGVMWDAIGRRDVIDVIGRGDDIFELIVVWQLAGITLLLPAMICSVITAEKERDSLSLLILSDLRPWEILISKLLSRLIPIFAFTLLGLPVLAVAYSMGGVTVDMLLTAVYLIVLTSLQVGTLGLLCSAYFRTTVKSFLATYIIGSAMYFGLPILDELRIIGLSEKEAFALWPIYWFVDGSRNISFLKLLVQTIPINVSIVIMLGLARMCVLRRAFVPPRAVLLNVFQAIDRWMSWANRGTGGVMIVKDVSDGIIDQPVRWRETTKRALGKASHLFRIGVVINVPVVLICAGYVYLTVPQSLHLYQTELFSVMLFSGWFASALFLCVATVNTFGSERSRQTLDVLLTTPIKTRDLIRQKLAGVRRLAVVFAIPMIILILTEGYLEANFLHKNQIDRYQESGGASVYLLGSLAAIPIYFNMVIWISLIFALKIKSQIKAMMSAIFTIAAWCVIPFLIAFMVFEFFRLYEYREVLWWAFIMSPVTLLALLEFSALREFKAMAPSVMPSSIITFCIPWIESAITSC